MSLASSSPIVACHILCSWACEMAFALLSYNSSISGLHFPFLVFVCFNFRKLSLIVLRQMVHCAPTELLTSVLSEGNASSQISEVVTTTLGGEVRYIFCVTLAVVAVLVVSPLPVCCYQLVTVVCLFVWQRQ